MALSSWLKKAYWFLAFSGLMYFVSISLLVNGWAQRHALYAHKLNTAWWLDPNSPEQFGFLTNQVRPFNITTADHEVLYCWHVLPIGAYIRNEGAIINEESGFVGDIRKTQAFKLLSTDPESRLVVYFHGNAGNVAQGWRTDTYRAVASGAPDKIHVLAFDYRGFGYSSGSPTERGLIIDGVSLVKWVLEVAKIPPERIVLLGQSLGTAVATAVAEDFAVSSNIDFAGIVLVASFSDIPTLLLTYTIKGVIPILSPLRTYPSLQRFFSSKVLDIWSTATRIRNLIRSSRKINLSLLHAKNDVEISWSHTEKLFYVAANATSTGLTTIQIDSVKGHQDLGNGGFLDTWNADGMKKISKEVVKQGGHNRPTTYPCVARTIFKAFGL